MLGETLVELCQSKQASYRNIECRLLANWLLEKLPDSNQVLIVEFMCTTVDTYFIFTKKNVANGFLIPVTLRWHRASVALVLKVDYFDYSSKKIE